MPYNRENYVELKKAFEKKNEKARIEAETRCEELCRKFPRIKAVEAALRSTGVRIMGEAFKGKEGLDARIRDLRRENDQLLQLRSELLTSYGYPADYFDVHYTCEKCHDLGYVNGVMCDCLRTALIEKTYETSGIGKLIRTQTFDTFSLDYYKADKRQYEVMKHIYEFCKKYAQSFSKSSGSLLFCGTTGLGKTHLSTSIAKTVIEKGFDVVYDTAQNVFSDFEAEHFGRSGSSNPEKARTAKYFLCDLLIIDDLGTEFCNQFTVSCLYNMINTRINHGKPMLINTNLKSDELLAKYDSRIVSRLFGEFTAHNFIGNDIRLKKLKNGRDAREAQ